MIKDIEVVIRLQDFALFYQSEFFARNSMLTIVNTIICKFRPMSEDLNLSQDAVIIKRKHNYNTSLPHY